MKQLTVYTKGSTYKYYPLYSKYCFSVKDRLLTIEKILEDGRSTTLAVFREWDYFLVEEK